MHNNKQKYFSTIIGENKYCDQVQFILIIHLVKDTINFISAVNSLGKIALIIAIPYSIDENVYKLLKNKFTISVPTLDELLNKKSLYSLINDIDANLKTIIIEIGGYFSAISKQLLKKFHHNLIGVIEDTEGGHRKYEQLDYCPFPVLSVARSGLKECEDALIGKSCITAMNIIFEEICFEISGLRFVVMGYGKIGKSLCRHLLKDNQEISVYDKMPTKRILAIHEGIPAIEKKLVYTADVIMGATGTTSIDSYDLPYLKPGAFLISCSSRNIEFDIPYIKKTFKEKQISDHVKRYENEETYFHLVCNGEPVNLSKKILVGETIYLVQGEILSAAIFLLKLNKPIKNVFQLPGEIQESISSIWLNMFYNESLEKN